MTYDTLDLLAHLLIAAGTIGTLLLFKDMRRSAPDEDMSVVYRDMYPETQQIQKKLDKILSRIGNVKTRLRDEEKDDQKRKAHERYIRHRDEQKGG